MTRNKSDLGSAWATLMSEMYYEYKGSLAVKLGNGYVSVVGKKMTIPEYKHYVDEAYKNIGNSINRLKK